MATQSPTPRSPEAGAAAVTAGVELLVDLIAATVARQTSTKLACVIHEAVRVMPMLESVCSTAYVNLRKPRLIDFRQVGNGLPRPRERIDASMEPGFAADLIQRAGLAVMSIATDAQAASALPQIEAGRRHWILYGEARAAGWSRAATLMKTGKLIPFELSGARLLISRDALEAAGGRPAIEPGADLKLLKSFAQSAPRRWKVNGHSAGLRLQMTADPIELVGVGTEMTSHSLMQESRALFSARGLGALLVPWGQRASLQLRLRNVHARIDDMVFAFERQNLKPARLDYTADGAVVSLECPAASSHADAVLHMALPAGATPANGFCDVGGVQLTVEVAQ